MHWNALNFGWWWWVVATKFSVKHQGKDIHHPPSTIYKWPLSDLPMSTLCPSLSLSFTIEMYLLLVVSTNNLVLVWYFIYIIIRVLIPAQTAADLRSPDDGGSDTDEDRGHVDGDGVQVQVSEHIRACLLHVVLDNRYTGRSGRRRWGRPPPWRAWARAAPPPRARSTRRTRTRRR